MNQADVYVKHVKTVSVHFSKLEKLFLFIKRLRQKLEKRPAKENEIKNIKWLSRIMWAQNVAKLHRITGSAYIVVQSWRKFIEEYTCCLEIETDVVTVQILRRWWRQLNLSEPHKVSKVLVTLYHPFSDCKSSVIATLNYLSLIMKCSQSFLKQWKTVYCTWSVIPSGAKKTRARKRCYLCRKYKTKLRDREELLFQFVNIFSTHNGGIDALNGS